MPESAVLTFTDPDAYHAAIRARHIDGVVTGRGDFHADLTRIRTSGANDFAQLSNGLPVYRNSPRTRVRNVSMHRSCSCTVLQDLAHNGVS